MKRLVLALAPPSTTAEATPTLSEFGAASASAAVDLIETSCDVDLDLDVGRAIATGLGLRAGWRDGRRIR